MQFSAIKAVALYLEEEQLYGFMIRQTLIVLIGIFCLQHTTHRRANGLNKHSSNLLALKCTKGSLWSSGKFFKSFMSELTLIINSNNYI